LYEIQQQQQQQQTKTTTKLIQTFPQEHSSSDYCISCLLQINPNTIVSSSSGYSPSDSDSDNVIVIWSKSKSSSLYELLQRITHKETGGWGISSLVLITQKKEEEEEEFASCSPNDSSIIIWRRGKGEFQIKQEITNVKYVSTLLYFSQINELISGSYRSLLQIWSPSSFFSSSKYKERHMIKTSSPILSLCHLNRNDSRRVEFASGHEYGQIMIWSKQQQINESNYSSIRTLQTFHNHPVNDLVFINDNEFNFLISCCPDENKIVIYKGEEEGEEEEELDHKEVRRLNPMSNGQFASGGENKCLNIWSPSFSFYS
jgi:hypothetical protein